MSLRLAAVFATFLLTGAAVAGCNSTESSTVGSPQSPSGRVSAPASPQSSSASSVPHVPNPVAVPGTFRQKPCELLTASQVSALGVPDEDGGNPDAEASLASLCAWSNGRAQTSVSVGWELANRGGLRDVYAQRGEMGYFIPVNIDGFPGVFGTPADTRSYGDCSLHVGVNEQDLMLVQYSKDGAPWRASCAKAKHAASAALETVKRGGQ